LVGITTCLHGSNFLKASKLLEKDSFFTCFGVL